jgi:beta-N-acetylhexosaminidase
MVGVTGSLDDVERAALARHRVGSVLYIGHSSDGVSATAARSAQVRRAGGDGVLVAVDQEGGLVQRLQGPGFAAIPSAADQAGLSAAALTEAATRWGRQLARAGVDLNLAPVADVVPRAKQRSNAPIGALGRGYGSRPDAVATHVLAFIAGMHAGGVGATVKHFPGLGEVVGNTDHTAGVVDDVTSADSGSLTPFREAAEAGVEAIMVASARYPRIDPDRIGVFSPAVIGILRDWGYEGVVISDDLGAAVALRAVPAGLRAVRFVAAGGDLAITADPALVPAMTAGLVARAKRDPVFDARLLEATARVLALKQSLGLPGCG